MARGHRLTGVDFAPAMIAEARRKAAARNVAVRFEEADAEQLLFAPASFDLVISRHLLWTLPHPEAAIDEWIRVLRPGGRLVVVDSQLDAGVLAAPSENARASEEYAAVGDQLPFLGGRSREEIEALLAAQACEREQRSLSISSPPRRSEWSTKGGSRRRPPLRRLGRRAYAPRGGA